MQDMVERLASSAGVCPILPVTNEETQRWVDIFWPGRPGDEHFEIQVRSLAEIRGETRR